VNADHLSAALRSAGFVALLQTAGMALFLALFSRYLTRSRGLLERTVRRSALAAALLLVPQYLLEAARMADALPAVLDPDLQSLAAHSAVSVVLVLRLIGCAVLVASLRLRPAARWFFVVLGVVAVVVSFCLTGHTVGNPRRVVLAPLLSIHVAIVAFWFGALVPLYVACRRETLHDAAALTQAFSRVAAWLVPMILLAGIAMAVGLVRDLAVLTTPYGYALLGKFLGFAVLMGIAALNKWRLAPALATGDEGAVAHFRRSLAAEYAILSAVLCLTAVMTLLYSPEQ
jgi:copper resistance protein D